MSFLLLLGTDGNVIQLNNSMIDDHICNSINSIQNKNELILLGCLDSWRKIHLRKIYTWENNIGITTWRCLVSIFFLTSVRHSAIALRPNSRAHERTAARYPYLLSRRLTSAFPKTYMGNLEWTLSIPFWTHWEWIPNRFEKLCVYYITVWIHFLGCEYCTARFERLVYYNAYAV